MIPLDWIRSLFRSQRKQWTILGNIEKDIHSRSISFIYGFRLVLSHSLAFCVGRHVFFCRSLTLVNKANNFDAFHFLWVIILILKYLWMGFSYLFDINYSYASAFSERSDAKWFYMCVYFYHIDALLHISWYSTLLGFDLYNAWGKMRKTHQITYVMNIVDGFFLRLPNAICCRCTVYRTLIFRKQFFLPTLFSLFVSILIILPHRALKNTLWHT